ncbi:hypothetical protein ACIBIZ_50370 [Nonomuraea spiralis]|uniref:hypothetical protein n=1 Tax=Nonomuraea spiralis TaxID=46182 RepID=UPI0037A401D3
MRDDRSHITVTGQVLHREPDQRAFQHGQVAMVQPPARRVRRGCNRSHARAFAAP